MNEHPAIGDLVVEKSVYMETARWEVECANEQSFVIVAQTFADAAALASAITEELNTDVLSVTHLGEDETVYDWSRE